MVELFHAFRDALYEVLKFFQQLAEPLLGGQSFWFSIVLLTIAVRIVLIPLTVKQVRSTRAMQELAPEIKKLQAKYKNDRQKLTEETMALYKERGFNPLAGCWPLLAQAPFFFALYHVIYADELQGEPNILRGKTFFGVPLEDHWLGLDWAHRLGSVDGLVILALILAMSLTTYISQKQLLSRQGASVAPQQQMLIKILPFTFLIFAVNVPLAIIIYWVTTNLWSMGQQYVLLRSAPPPPAVEAPEPAAANGNAGRSAGPFSFFRNLMQLGGNEDAAPSPNGGGAKKASASRPASKEAAKAGTDGKPPPAGKPDGRTAKGGQQGPPSKSGPPAKSGPQARPGQPNTRAGQGQSGSRRSSGGRSSRKGKSGGGPRRGKR
jgi:YidC/Oxa1 family membrane protein insertase